MPIGGYTQIFEKMLEDSEVRLNCDYFEDREYYNNLADKVIYTGPIDKFFDYQFGKLDYRSLKWENHIITNNNFSRKCCCKLHGFRNPLYKNIRT